MNEAGVRELYERAIAARRGGGRERCATPEAMLALVRREGSDDERLATLDHVMSCEACQRELELLRAIDEAGAKTTGVPVGSAGGPSPGGDVGRWRRFVPLALAASLLLAVGVTLRDRFPGRGVEDVARGDGAAVTLAAPASDAEITPGAGLTFVWHPTPDARQYAVEVLDESGRVVMTANTTDTVVMMPNVSDLRPGGEYQWWVRASVPGGTHRASSLRRLRVRSR